MKNKHWMQLFIEDVSENVKKELASKLVAFALGSCITLVFGYFTLLADHQRLGAVEADKVDKKVQIEIDKSQDVRLDDIRRTVRETNQTVTNIAFRVGARVASSGAEIGE